MTEVGDGVPVVAAGLPWVALIVTAIGAVAVSAFLAFSETCLTSLSESRIHAIMAGSGKRARALELWLRQPHAVLATILVGNTLAGIVGTAILTKLTLDATGEAGVSLVVGVMTFLILIFGEITPKTLARHHAMRAAVPTILMLRVVHYALLPLTWSLSQIARVFSRAIGGGNEGRIDVSEAELEAMVDLGGREGVLPAAKADQLRAVFRLYERTVREIMVPRTDVVALDLSRPAPELVRQLDVSRHSRLPAYRGRIDEVAGVIYAKDVLHGLVDRPQPLATADLEGLMREPLFVPESLRLDALLRLFRRQHLHLAIVLDEFGGTAGIVTLEDVLEELVGEIWDEHDEEAPVLVRRGPGRWTAEGRIPLSELEAKLGLEFPETVEYETLGGLLMELAGRVPPVGSAHEFGGFRFEVLTADEKRVGLVRAVRLDAR